MGYLLDPEGLVTCPSYSQDNSIGSSAHRNGKRSCKVTKQSYFLNSPLKPSNLPDPI